MNATQQIDARIKELGDWRGQMLSRLRALIAEAVPDVVEEWKWMTPVWSRDGIICTGETYKKVVKMTFAKGAALPDPAKLFNSSLEGNVRRAIDFHEGEKINEKALKALIRAAAAVNASKAPPRSKQATRPTSTKAGTKKKVVLLSGGNPQIAKADGDKPVQAYIAALSGWQRDVAKRIDAIVVKSVPNVIKAVKWNSPFYGIEGQGWFLSVHAFTHYLKVAFFRGASLKPMPPGPSKDKNTRYLDVRAGELDDAQLAAWVTQAAALPGWMATTKAGPRKSRTAGR